MKRVSRLKVFLVLTVLLVTLLAQASASELPVGGKRVTASGGEAQLDMLMEISSMYMTSDDFDEQTQTVVDAVVNAFKLTTRESTSDTLPSYSVVDVEFADAPLLRVAVVEDENALYLSSELLGDKPVRLANADAEAFFERMLAYLAESEEFSEFMVEWDALLEEINTLLSSEDMELAAAQLEAWDIEPIFEAFAAWLDQAWIGAPYEGEIVSIYDAEIATCVIYDITKDEIVSLLETIMPMIVQREAMLADILNIAAEQEGYVLTETELKDALLQTKATLSAFPYLVAGAIPDSFELCYNECYDANGDFSVGELEFFFEQEYGNIALYAEWLAEEPRIYVYMSDGDASYGIEGWFLTDMQSDGTENVDIGLDIYSYWREELDQTINIGLYVATGYNDLGQIALDMDIYFATEDAYSSSSFDYLIYGTIATDADNAGSVNYLMSMYEDEETIMDMAFSLDSQFVPAQGLPLDLSVPMYDLFSDTPEGVILWLSETVPNAVEAWSAQVQTIMDEFIAPYVEVVE